MGEEDDDPKLLALLKPDLNAGLGLTIVKHWGRKQLTEQKVTSLKYAFPGNRSTTEAQSDGTVWSKP